MIFFLLFTVSEKELKKCFAIKAKRIHCEGNKLQNMFTQSIVPCTANSKRYYKIILNTFYVLATDNFPRHLLTS